jgi:transglutaminase-like putative cysteine protease
MNAQLVREIRDGKDVLVGRTEQLLRVNVGGQTVERGQAEERVYEARPGGRLLSFRSSLTGDGGERVVSGTCARERCAVKIEAPGGAAEERTVEGVTETADLADGTRLAAALRSAVRGRQLDTMKVRAREVQAVFLRRERIAGAGVQEEVSVVAESEAGDRLAVEWRIADDGRVVEIRYGEAIVARPEPEDRARSLETVDLFALGRVALPGPLPRAVPATVVYRFQGLPASFQKDDARQRFTRAPEGATLLTVSAHPPAAADPTRDTPVGRAAQGAPPEDLAPSAEADADSPAVARLAREVAGGAPGAYAAAVRLSDHVYRRLEKAYGASHDRASDVLAAGKGDCTEHAVLTVALARALGIPARQVHGLVYARYADGQDALYWHAWVEVRSAGEWIALDPTFGQPVADATHIALGGENRVDTVGLLGALKVASVEVTEQPREGKGARSNRRGRP